MNSKSKRKFRVKDNQFLLDTYLKVIQISSKIEEKCVDGVIPEMLPTSIVPTHILYDITASFESLYDALFEEELVAGGFHKANKTSH